MLLCWLGQGIPGLVIASLLVGLGDGFRSGADQALLYRSCVALDREADFQRIEARTGAVRTSAMVGLVMAGGLIVNAWGFAAAWLVETLLCATGLVLACVMVEPPAAAAAPPEPQAPPNGRGAGTRGSLTLAALILPLSLLGGLASAASFLAQTSGESNPQRLTMLVAAITLAEAAGSIVAVRMPSSGGTHPDRSGNPWVQRGRRCREATSGISCRRGRVGVSVRRGVSGAGRGDATAGRRHDAGPRRPDRQRVRQGVRHDRAAGGRRLAAAAALDVYVKPQAERMQQVLGILEFVLARPRSGRIVQFGAHATNGWCWSV